MKNLCYFTEAQIYNIDLNLSSYFYIERTSLFLNKFVETCIIWKMDFGIELYYYAT